MNAKSMIKHDKKSDELSNDQIRETLVLKIFELLLSGLSIENISRDPSVNLSVATVYRLVSKHKMNKFLSDVESQTLKNKFQIMADKHKRRTSIPEGITLVPNGFVQSHVVLLPAGAKRFGLFPRASNVQVVDLGDDGSHRTYLIETFERGDYWSLPGNDKKN